jgi:WXG100 family type VII secretion target
MATRASIEFDYQKAMQDANKVDDIAGRLSALATSKFDSTMQNLAANWKGDNASMYLNKGAKLEDNMKKTAGELRDIASAIRRIAKRVREAELKALEIAESRSYQ